MKITIQSPHFTADKKLLDFIDRKLNKLGQYYDRILEIGVILKLENTGQVKDKIAEVKMSVPGHLLLATAQNKTFEAAIDEVVDVAKRRLIKHKDRIRSF